MASEKRLIDANRTEEQIKISYKPAWMVVRDMPTVDAVEVVRCKDCKHLMFSDCYGECGRAYLSGIVRPDDFCSYGERKQMWEKSNHCYSEKDMLKMLKSASIEQLMEFLLEIKKGGQK